jgi:hypothetical protein
MQQMIRKRGALMPLPWIGFAIFAAIVVLFVLAIWQ